MDGGDEQGARVERGGASRSCVLGLVAIGRNEGNRLERCLASALEHVAHVVYVDSGSTDDSVARARALGADVVELDTNTPFTAARARNAGF
ncbi:MAG TPA: glycosyltransferase, partial [Polyangiaceae bacterium]|nr:glycosyltransferase [Polyangiaceae bacterium]